MLPLLPEETSTRLNNRFLPPRQNIMKAQLSRKLQKACDNSTTRGNKNGSFPDLKNTKTDEKWKYWLTGL